MKYAFAFLLPLFVMSCAGNKAEVETTEPTVETTAPAMDTETMPADAGLVSINETVDAVNAAGGDITAVAPASAIVVVDGWIAKLSSMPEAAGIVGNLNALKGQLASGAPDAKTTGDLLTKLGLETQALATDNVALQGLSSALTAGGAKLSGM